METGPRILVIDDEPVIRKGCARILAEEKFQVRTAEDGPKGLSLLAREAFNLVLLDLVLPGMDGMETLARIRRDHPDLPVIVITGYATVERAVRAMKAGATDFLAKPFLPGELRAAVRRALEPGSAAVRRTGPGAPHDAALEVSSGNDRARAILYSAPVGLVVTDCEGRVVFANPAAEAYLEGRTQPLDGHRLGDCFREDVLGPAVARAVTEGAPSTFEVPPGPLGCRFLKVLCAPVMIGEAGGILGAVLVLDDVTAARKADQVKSEFVGTVVHELRAPLATVQQLIYFLRDAQAGPLTDAQTEILTRVQVRVAELLDLIRNLLNLAKLEAGMLVFKMEPVDLGPLLLASVESFQTAAQARKISIAFRDAEDARPVMGDRENLRIAMNNLVGNAVKYNREGGRVDVELACRGDLAVVTVRDTGLGIREEDLPRVFEKFFRVRDEHTRWITGSGLGLSVTRSIVENHGGRIEVESTYGVGTTFRVFLPCPA